MPVKAVIPSIGTVIIEGAAEESTLRQLLSAMGKSSGGGVPTGSNAAAAAEVSPDEEKAMNKRLAAGEKAEKSRLELLQRGGEALNNILGETANNFSRSFSNVTPSIKDFSGLLSEYAPGAIGDTVKALGGVFDDQVQIFRHLSQSGIDLGDSLLSAQLKAGEARLPLEIFANTVKENSQSLSTAFGSATQGADKFASVQGKFMEKSGQRFAALGFSMEELAANNASYIEQLNRSGRLRGMQDSEIAAGAAKYNEELDKLSKATGISRKELDEQNKAAARDARMKMALSKLSEEERTAVNAKISQLNQMDPSGELAAGFKDLIAGNGVALTAAARNLTMTLSAAGVDAGKMTRDIAKGQAGAIQQMNDGFYKAGKAGEQLSEGQRNLAMATSTMGQKVPAFGLAQLAGMQDTNAAIEKAKLEQAEKEAAAKKDPTRAAAGLDQVLTQVQNTIKKGLIDTQVFNVVGDGLNVAGKAATGMANAFEQANLPTKLAMAFGPAVVKEVGALIKEYGGKAIIAGSVVTAGAAAAKMSVDEYKLRRSGDLKSDERYVPPDDGKKPGKIPSKPGKEVAEEIGEKPSWLSKLGGALKRNKVYVAGITVGGAMVYFHEELMDLVVPDVTKFVTNKVVEATGLPLGMTGANIPQNVQPGANAQTVTGQMSKEVSDINTALKSIDFSKLAIPESVGTSIDQSIIKLKTLKDTISVTTSSFKELNNVNLNTLNESINKLSSAVERQNTAPAAEKVSTAPEGTGVVEKELVALMNQLNMTMGQMVTGQMDAVDYLSKTAKYTRQASNIIA